MRIITESVVAALKQVGVDATTLSEAELAQVDAHIAETVAAQVSTAVDAKLGEDRQRLTDLEADMAAIRDSIGNGELTAEATTHTIAAVVGMQDSVQNAQDVQGVGTNLPPGTIVEGGEAGSNDNGQASS